MKTKDKDPFVVSQNKKSGVYMVHNRKYPHIVLYINGDKDKALQACERYNKGVKEW